MTECKHNYVYVGSTGRGVGGRKIKVGRKTIKTIALTLSFYCTKCKRSLERKATPGERAFHKQNCYALYKPMSIHKVWHDFRKRFMKKGSITEFKWSGYDLILRVERWAKKYPDDVRICSVDDSHFCGSYLVLIESKNKNTQPVYEPFRYMGTNVVFIPQCSGESPIQFFLEILTYTSLS